MFAYLSGNVCPNTVFQLATLKNGDKLMLVPVGFMMLRLVTCIISSRIILTLSIA